MFKLRLLKFSLFILLIIAIDQLVGFYLHRLYFSQKAGPNQALNYLFTECKTDILIFGNSRAQHHYDPRILSDSLGMSCYNAGQDGGHSILLPYAQIEVVLKRYSPKIIILEFDPSSMKYRAEDYDKLSILLPYYNLYPELRPLIHKRSSYEKVKQLSCIYPYNSNIINLIRFNTNTHAARKRDFDGYVPIMHKYLTTKMLEAISSTKQNNPVDTNKLLALERIIQSCKLKKVTLLLINSPAYSIQGQRDTQITLADSEVLEVLRRENATYLDFSCDSAFTGQMQLFADKLHLNDAGAKVFTNMLTGILKNKTLLSLNIENVK